MSKSKSQRTPTNCVDLGIRQLVAKTMRSYPDMPADPIRGDPVRKATTKADRAVLRSLADLACELGFNSDQIRTMKQYPGPRTTRESPQRPPLLVTSGNGVDLRHRSGIPRTAVFEEDRDSLYIDCLHSQEQVQGEGITSFFVGKSIYLAFFGRPLSTNGRSANRPPSPTGSTSRNMGRSAVGSNPHESLSPERPDKGGFHGSPEYMDINDILSSYDHQSGECERQEQERENGEREERRRERERLARERLANKRLERERLERERLEEQRLARGKVLINFIIRERGVWRHFPQIGVHPDNATEIERVAKKYMRNGLRAFGTVKMLAPQECFQAVQDDRTHTILLVAQNDLNADDEVVESASKLHADARKRVLGLKRIVREDIYGIHHV